MVIIKNYKQIIGIRKSCQLAAKSLKYIASFIQAGVTTGYLDELIAKFIKDNGATSACLGYNGFPRSCCISPNEIICHGIPGDRVLKNGDILNIDVTTVLDSYFGDTSVMFQVGEISEETKKILNVAKKCLEIGISQIKPGNYIGNIGYEINKYAESQKCSVVTQFCSHGTGFFFS